MLNPHSPSFEKKPQFTSESTPPEGLFQHYSETSRANLVKLAYFFIDKWVTICTCKLEYRAFHVAIATAQINPIWTGLFANLKTRAVWPPLNLIVSGEMRITFGREILCTEIFTN